MVVCHPYVWSNYAKNRRRKTPKLFKPARPAKKSLLTWLCSTKSKLLSKNDKHYQARRSIKDVYPISSNSFLNSIYLLAIFLQMDFQVVSMRDIINEKKSTENFIFINAHVLLKWVETEKKNSSFCTLLLTLKDCLKL